MKPFAALVLPWLVLAVIPAVAVAAAPQPVADLGVTQELDTYGVWIRNTAPATAAGRTFFVHNDGIHGFEPPSLGGGWVLRWPAFGLDLAAWANGLLFFPAGIDYSNDET